MMELLVHFFFFNSFIIMCVLDHIKFEKIPGEIIQECKENPEFRNTIVRGIIKLILYIGICLIIMEVFNQFLLKHGKVNKPIKLIGFISICLIIMEVFYNRKES